jgi:hypothetical protein
VFVRLTETAPEPSFLAAEVMRSGLKLVHFSEEEASLEEIFLHVTKGQVA